MALAFRRLSGQTAEAARRIPDSIAQAAAAIDTEMASAQALQGDGSPSTASCSATHLGDVVPHLGARSGEMDSGMATVTTVNTVNTDIIDTLLLRWLHAPRELLAHLRCILDSARGHAGYILDPARGHAGYAVIQRAALSSTVAARPCRCA